MRASSVSPSSYTNTILNQSARVLSKDCFLMINGSAGKEVVFVFVFSGFEGITGLDKLILVCVHISNTMT